MTAIAMFETMSSPVLDVLKVPVALVRALHARHSQRRMIAELLDRHPSHLEDMGISLADLRDALGSPSPIDMLAARRAERARNWSPDIATA